MEKLILPHDRSRSRHRRAALYSFLLTAAILWIAADGLIGLPTLRRPSVSVTVPCLVGRAFIDGALADPSLFTPSVTYVYDDHAAPRTVLSQTPAAGASRKVIPGVTPCPISLVVSLGRWACTLPDTRGMDARVAKALLIEKGLTVTLSPVTLIDGEARHIPAHAVLDMTPAPGTTAGDTTRVTLFVAEPIRDHGVLCPDTVGLSLTEAAARLSEAGLQIGDISTTEARDKISSPSLENGLYNPWHFHMGKRVDTVIKQDKLAGSYLPRGTTVSLTVYAPDGS